MVAEIRATVAQAVAAVLGPASAVPKVVAAEAGAILAGSVGQIAVVVALAVALAAAAVAAEAQAAAAVVSGTRSIISSRPTFHRPLNSRPPPLPNQRPTHVPQP